MPAYKYQPLSNPKAIRLLQRRPNEFLASRPLQYFFDTEKLEDDYGPMIPYSALSYTWGTQVEKKTVTVEYFSFEITPSLDNALEAFFYTNPEARIWVDAICINQNDLNERDQQVRRMKTIYQRAEKVFVYLGDTPHTLVGSTAGLNPLNVTNAWKLAKYLSAISTVIQLDWGVNVVLQNAFLDLSRDPILADPTLWKLLRRLFQDSWFERLWVIQELAASQETVVMWGGIFIPWETLKEAASFILRPGKASPPKAITDYLPNIGAHRLKQEAKCTDYRDKLFAILGVVEDIQDVEIDYAKPVNDVYRQWAIKRITRLHSLDVLEACANSAKHNDLPSWVPDLRRLWGQDKQLWAQNVFHERPLWYISLVIQANSLLDWRHNGEWVLDMKGLSVCGNRLGIISNLSEIADVIHNLTDTSNVAGRLLEIILGWEQWLLLGERNANIIDKYYKFVCVILRSVNDSQLFYRYYSVLLGLISTRNLPRPHHVPKTMGWLDLEGVDIKKEFERLMFPRLHGCQIFEIFKDTELGIVAGNCETQPHDQVWLLQGVQNPIILRPKNDHFQVITTCFLSVDWDTWARRQPKSGPSFQEIILV
ncbi:hypothetical protein GLAREA_04085 [Glarea lozoyensis ATCC 20868]|uniref:Heterokaryon incompatibility domain-containing protein n=1 Tax=Glarea lozoyensis (strain ATCC 20868 / MF5171) TaxID=1116229 RepID=S3DXM7_GLAL2|nr:uncharacterized protein GLAREA_04085 [Glarea lozoyensis ATCC 20868]EPE31118.1 hypothetical protein GLAREA_04085 [Glarea lozoyensis ATCC 20868]